MRCFLKAKQGVGYTVKYGQCYIHYAPSLLLRENAHKNIKDSEKSYREEIFKICFKEFVSYIDHGSSFYIILLTSLKHTFGNTSFTKAF